MSLKRKHSPSLLDQMLLELKEPVALPEAKEINDFNGNPEACPQLSEEFVRALLKISFNQGAQRQLLKLSMLARGLEAYMNGVPAPDGNIVILSFALLSNVPNQILLLMFKKKKKVFNDVASSCWTSGAFFFM